MRTRRFYMVCENDSGISKRTGEITCYPDLPYVNVEFFTSKKAALKFVGQNRLRWVQTWRPEKS
jgi:hypothetical protein